MSKASLKAAIESTLTRGPVGWIVSRIAGEWITSPSVPRDFPAVLVNAPHGIVSQRARARLFWGFHEAQEIRYAAQFFGEDLDIVELGSSLGVVSAHLAQRLCPQRRLICVEANPRLASKIAETIRRNATYADFVVVNAAVNYSGKPLARFAVSGDVVMSHLAVAGEPGIDVPSVTLREILERYSIGEYALACDIEGAEEQIFQSDSGSLSPCRAMMIELHATKSNSIENLVNQVTALGFQIIARRGPVLFVRK